MRTYFISTVGIETTLWAWLAATAGMLAIIALFAWSAAKRRLVERVTTGRNRLTRLRWASALLIAQGTLMEFSVFIALLALFALRVPQTAITERVEIFALPYLNENLYMMMAISGIFGTLRIIGAIAMARNHLWGLVLSLINCGVTLVLMIFLLPPGLLDGILTGTALVLIISAWLRSTPIVDPTGTES